MGDYPGECRGIRRSVNSFDESNGGLPGVATGGSTAATLVATEDAAVDDRPDPFHAMPPLPHIVVTFLIGLAAMVTTLSLAGVLITSSDALSRMRAWDESISADAADGRTSGPVDLARFVTATGDTVPIIALLAAVTLVLVILRKWRAIAFLPLAMAAEITTFLSVNYLVGRERPAVEKIGPLPGTYSFPSGHVAATFVLWIGISVLLAAYGFRWCARIVGALGTLMAVAMAWARVYLGMHHTIDVIFGFAMGVAAVTVVVIVLNVDFRERRAPVPRTLRDPEPPHPLPTELHTARVARGSLDAQAGDRS